MTRVTPAQKEERKEKKLKNPMRELKVHVIACGEE